MADDTDNESVIVYST